MSKHRNLTEAEIAKIDGLIETSNLLSIWAKKVKRYGVKKGYSINKEGFQDTNLDYLMNLVQDVARFKIDGLNK